LELQDLKGVRLLWQSLYLLDAGAGVELEERLKQGWGETEQRGKGAVWGGSLAEVSFERVLRV
jgi:hypothetical protein